MLGESIVRVQFLYWEECPSHPKAWQRLNAVLAELGVSAKIERIAVTTDEQAARLRFLGSPTIRIDDQDIDPAANQQPVRLSCRLYYTEDRRPSPLPSEAMIGRAVLKALSEERTHHA